MVKGWGVVKGVGSVVKGVGHTPPALQLVVASDGTHPTGMHSCC